MNVFYIIIILLIISVIALASVFLTVKKKWKTVFDFILKKILLPLAKYGKGIGIVFFILLSAVALGVHIIMMFFKSNKWQENKEKKYEEEINNINNRLNDNTKLFSKRK
ncbi:MAG: hypothetical protein JXB50_16865 [Spirochaetes bacterium]|nr:hypothetical protein [Spirochaetota bacterium]